MWIIKFEWNYLTIGHWRNIVTHLAERKYTCRSQRTYLNKKLFSSLNFRINIKLIGIAY